MGKGGSLRTRDVLGEECVVGAFRAIQRQHAAVAGGGGEPRVNERLPVVRVDEDVGKARMGTGTSAYGSGASPHSCPWVSPDLRL